MVPFLRLVDHSNGGADQQVVVVVGIVPQWPGIARGMILEIRVIPIATFDIPIGTRPLLRLHPPPPPPL